MTVTVAEWSELHMYLPPEEAAFIGPYRLANAPYLKPLYEAYDDHAIREVEILKGMQQGVSRALVNIAAFAVAVEKRHVLWLSTAYQWHRNVFNRAVDKFMFDGKIVFGSSLSLIVRDHYDVIIIDGADRLAMDEGDPRHLACTRDAGKLIWTIERERFASRVVPGRALLDIRDARLMEVAS